MNLLIFFQIKISLFCSAMIMAVRIRLFDEELLNVDAISWHESKGINAS